MEIYTHKGRVEGSAVFDYRGYSISWSTISVPDSIVVFPSIESRKPLGEFMGSINGFKEAIEFVDLLSS